MNRPIKVMLIDDDPGIHESLRAVIEEAGYEFCGALGGREGLRLLDDERPDLLLLDVMMPGESGLSLTRSIAADKQIPVILLTARSEAESRIAGLEAGADDYLAKPFDPRELVLRINNILKRNPGADQPS